VDFENTLQECGDEHDLTREELRTSKQLGYSDVQLSTIFDSTPMAIRQLRLKHGIQPVYKLVDTCAAEFEAYTPYYYSTYETPFRTVGSMQGSGVRGQESGVRGQGSGVMKGADFSAESASKPLLPTAHCPLPTDSLSTDASD